MFVALRIVEKHLRIRLTQKSMNAFTLEKNPSSVTNAKLCSGNNSIWKNTKCCTQEKSHLNVSTVIKVLSRTVTRKPMKLYVTICHTKGSNSGDWVEWQRIRHAMWTLDRIILKSQVRSLTLLNNIFQTPAMSNASHKRIARELQEVATSREVAECGLTLELVRKLLEKT